VSRAKYAVARRRIFDLLLQPGAFEEGAEVDVSAFWHQVWKGGMPVGVGRIRTTREEALVEAQCYMDVTAGRNSHRVPRRQCDAERLQGGDPSARRSSLP
jgi:hypothetical protein